MQGLTVLLPVSRPWSMVPVCEAIAASDIPRSRLILIQDAPGCEAWEQALIDIGFTVELHLTELGAPPAVRKSERCERRDRHRTMRRYSQTLVPDGPLLCLEDDTLVPPDIYARLSAIGPHSSGIQVGRHGGEECGVYRHGVPLTVGRGTEWIEACGHYCLLTTGEAYRAAAITDHAAVDVAHTAQLPGLRCDWDCVCGHLTPDAVLWPRGRSRAVSWL